MKKVIRTTSFLLFIACLLVSNLYIADAYEDNKTIGQLKKELAQFEEDYKNNRLEANVSEQERNRIQQNINSINQNITQIGDDITQLNEQIKALQAAIVKDEEEIQDILSFTQIQNGESAYLEYAFGAKDFTDFIYRIAVSEQMTSYNNELIERDKQNIEDNKKKTEDLATKKASLADEQKKLQGEMTKIQLTLSQLNNEVTTIEDQIKLKKETLETASNHNCRDDQTLNDCMRGILPPDTAFWRPIQTGYVSGWFGWRWHPIWNDYRMHYGMDLSNTGANNGTMKEYAIANGVVVAVFNNYSSCGGKKVYIKHNVNGVIYTSGYWHLNAVYVSKDQVVTKDTVIGVAAGYPDPTYGKTDQCANGGHVHLELSTGDWASGTYESNRVDAKNYINFPSKTYVFWHDRTTKF